MRKRTAVVLALVTMLALVATPVALADENEGGWWGNIAGYPYPGSPICLTAVDGSMINNCHAQDPLRPYEPIKFDGVPPKQYIVTSGPAKAFMFAQPGKDNIIDWAWGVPGWWHAGLPMPTAPGWHMWKPGGDMTQDGFGGTVVNVEQEVKMTGGGSAEQSVSVKSNGPTKVNVEQKVDMKGAAPVMKHDGKPAPKVVCFTYIVKSGDNLTRIANRFHDTISGLVSRNHIKNASKIFIGQRLTVCDP